MPANEKPLPARRTPFSVGYAVFMEVHMNSRFLPPLIVALALVFVLPLANVQAQGTRSTVSAVVSTNNVATYNAVKAMLAKRSLTVNQNVVLPGGKKAMVGVSDLVLVQRTAINAGGSAAASEGNFVHELIKSVYNINDFNAFVSQLEKLNAKTFSLRAVTTTSIGR